MHYYLPYIYVGDGFILVINKNNIPFHQVQIRRKYQKTRSPNGCENDIDIYMHSSCLVIPFGKASILPILK